MQSTMMSSIFVKSFHFPFPNFVLFVLWYFPFHVVYNSHNFVVVLIHLSLPLMYSGTDCHNEHLFYCWLLETLHVFWCAQRFFFFSLVGKMEQRTLKLIFKIRLISDYKLIICARKNYNLNPREKFEPASGLEPRTSRSLAWCSTT